MYELIYKIKKFFYINKNLINIFSLVFVFITTFFVTFLVYKNKILPKKNSYLDNMQQINSIEYNIKELEQIRDDYSLIESKINQMSALRNNIVNIIPDKKDVPYIISQITIAAQQTNVEIKEMYKIVEGYKKINNIDFLVIDYKINAVSKYSDFVAFLRSLEQLRSLFSVEYIKVSLYEPQIKNDNSQNNKDSNESYVKQSDKIQSEINIYIYLKKQ